MNRPKKTQQPTSIRHYKADLSVLYSAPGHALYADLPSGVENPRCTRLIRGLENCGAPAPLTENRKGLRNGGEQFHALGDLEENYYPTKADRRIIETCIEIFMDRMKGQAMVSLCSGYANKDVLMLTKALDKHLEIHYPGDRPSQQVIDKVKKEIWPTYIILNDKDDPSLKRAVDNFCTIGYPRKNIFTMHDDVNDPNFYVSLGGLIHGLGSDRPVVTMLGATFNDFDANQRKKLLENFCTLPEGSHFIVSIDVTTNKEALEKAYINPRMKQFFLTGAEHFLKAKTHMDLAFDPANAAVEIEVREHEAGLHIHFAVRDKNNICEWNTIEKISAPAVASMFNEAATDIFAIMTREQQPYDGVDYVLYDLVKRPSSRNDSRSGNLVL